MNYLAHVFLAQHSKEAMLGAFLGDFVKASLTEQYPPAIANEILLHRKIDSYTDAHPVTQAARALFTNGRRRYAGILLDVFYDHLLSKNWAAYSDQALPAFILRFYETLDTHQHFLPNDLAAMTPRMIDQDWLGSYRDYQGVEIAIHRISTRLSRNGHLLREGLPDLQTNYAAIASGFDSFFPELMQFTAEERKKFA
jgi:acyl carrier protein phosphodiesterase